MWPLRSLWTILLVMNWNIREGKSRYRRSWRALGGFKKSSNSTINTNYIRPLKNSTSAIGWFLIVKYRRCCFAKFCRTPQFSPIVPRTGTAKKSVVSLLASYVVWHRLLIERLEDKYFHLIKYKNKTIAKRSNSTTIITSTTLMLQFFIISRNERTRRERATGEAKLTYNAC